MYKLPKDYNSTVIIYITKILCVCVSEKKLDGKTTQECCILFWTNPGGSLLSTKCSIIQALNDSIFSFRCEGNSAVRTKLACLKFWVKKKKLSHNLV